MAFGEAKERYKKVVETKKVLCKQHNMPYNPTADDKIIEALTICEDAETMGELATNPPLENQSL